MQHEVGRPGLDVEIHLQDIQALNDGLANGSFDVAKASFFAGLQLASRTVVLPSGAAVGRGVGPLLLSAQPTTLDALRQRSQDGPIEILCPGETTTATFLCRTVLPFPIIARNVVFSDILPRLASGQSALGACIHEARFVWQQSGLHLVCDLGELWELATGQMLPLGGLFACSDLPLATVRTISELVRESIEYAMQHRDQTLPTMRRFAQELDDEAIWAHVDLYVNRWTMNLGIEGLQALKAFEDVARKGQLIADSDPGFQTLVRE
jgi:1,4-dihydroxy-6-naphthoate synthase